MAGLKLVFSALTGQFEAAFKAINDPIAKAATGAITDAANQIKTQGRANIASAGFSSKWTNALRVNVYPKTGTSAGAALLAYHKIFYSGVFESGATITGKPLLWIPLTGTPARVAGRRLTPRTFTQLIGPLTPMRSRTGKPLLGSPVSGRVGSKITLAKLRRGAKGLGAHVQLTPMFVGVPSIHIKARFGLQAVFDKAANGLGAGYLSHLSV